MGIKHEFKCNGCGYTAHVAGGTDGGFIIRSQTGFCTKCNELVDYVTGYHGEHAEFRSDDDIGMCHRCRKPVTQDWNQGDPCPRCGGQFGAPLPYLIWD